MKIVTGKKTKKMSKKMTEKKFRKKDLVIVDNL